jgi:hypothetical protein
MPESKHQQIAVKEGRDSQHKKVPIGPNALGLNAKLS